VGVVAAVVLMDLTASAERLRAWRDDPVRFVREAFQAEPDPWQADVLRAFGRPEVPRIAIQACVGPGKTAVLAWCAWHFLTTAGRRGEHPRGLAVSVTWDNLRGNLWAELATWQARSPLLQAAFELSGERVVARHAPNTWYLAARSWPKGSTADEQAKTLAGLHGPAILAILDESGGIPPAVLRAAEQALATRPRVGKILQAGNPVSLESALYEAASRLRHQWWVRRVTGDPDDPARAPRVDQAWAREQIAAYGREDPWVRTRILGLWPEASLQSLLGVDDVEAAMRRHLPEDAYEWAQRRIGVDVARFGDDRTVIFPRQGLAAFQPVVLRGMRTTELAARVARAITTWSAELTLIDDTGHWGHGVVDQLLTAGYPVQAVIASDRALDRRYRNRRAECWLQMAEWVRRGGALPPVPELVAELTSPTYSFVGGQFLLEPKDQVKRRLGRSPDLADALALTFAVPDLPRDLALAQATPGRAARDGDPWTL
jgi:hypothetical protein